MTTSMYYYDPDRNQVELLFDNFHTARDGRDYMTSRSASDKNPVGIDFDPDEMVARIRKGLDIEELADINALSRGWAITVGEVSVTPARPSVHQVARHAVARRDLLQAPALPARQRVFGDRGSGCGRRSRAAG